MPASTTHKDTALQHGFESLLKCDQSIEHCIAAEQRQPLPNAAALQLRGSERRRLQGELARYDGLFRTLSRGRSQN